MSRGGGGGALGKRDIDILVMHLPETYANTRIMGNQDLSIDLRTDVSPIKLLRYRAKLRYPSKGAVFVARDFLYGLDLAQFEANKWRLVFIIEDCDCQRPVPSFATQSPIMKYWHNRQEFKARVREWATKLGVQAHTIYVRPMRNKWASCSTAGSLSFNDELLTMDRDLGDYVIVHELLHFSVPNHCKLWKALMSVHLGDWEALHERLNGLARQAH